MDTGKLTEICVYWTIAHAVYQLFGQFLLQIALCKIQMICAANQCNLRFASAECCHNNGQIPRDMSEAVTGKIETDMFIQCQLT